MAVSLIAAFGTCSRCLLQVLMDGHDHVMLKSLMLGVSMGILAHPPEDFRKLRLYQLLRAKSDASDGAAERAELFIKAATPLVDLIIAGPMREFTLHNRDHSKKLLHLAEYVVSPSSLDSLTVLDCL